MPDQLLESVSLCGLETYVAERIAAFGEGGVSRLRVVPVPTSDQTRADVIAKVNELIDQSTPRTAQSLVGDQFLR